MKRSTRSVIIVAACAAALGVTTIILQKTGSSSASSSSSVSSSTTVQLVSKSSSDVVSMKVTNQNGTYTLVPTTTQNLTASGTSSATTNYNVQELTGLPIDTSRTSSVVQNGFSLTASKEIGTVSSLADYGLDNPQATVLVTFKDGSTYGYKIGSVTATSTTSYYMCGDKSDTVYVVSINSGLLQGPSYFLNTSLITVATASTSSSTTTATSSSSSYDFTSIRLSGSAYPTGVTLQPTVIASTGATSLKIVAPGTYDVNSDNLSTLEGCLTTVTADSAVVTNPDAAALEKYGISNPTAVVEYTVNEEHHKLTIGAKDEESGNYYIMADNRNVIYSITASSVDGIVSQSLYALRTKLIFLPNITTVKTISYTVNGTTTNMETTRTEKASSATASSGSTTEYDYAVTVNGQQLDYDKNYRYTYERLISLSITGETEEMPTGTPEVEIRYQYFDSGNTDVIDLYPSATRRYTVVLNGAIYGICNQVDVETLESTFADFFAGKTISAPF